MSPNMYPSQRPPIAAVPTWDAERPGYPTQAPGAPYAQIPQPAGGANPPPRQMPNKMTAPMPGQYAQRPAQAYNPANTHPQHQGYGQQLQQPPTQQRMAAPMQQQQLLPPNQHMPPPTQMMPPPTQQTHMGQPPGMAQYPTMMSQGGPPPMRAAAPTMGPPGMLKRPGMSPPMSSTQGGYGGPASQHGYSAQSPMSQSDMLLMNELAEKNPPAPLVRASLTRLPANSTVKTKAHVPLGIVYQAFDQTNEVPVVNMGTIKVIRCVKCRAYINCFVKFLENGNRWACALCGQNNEVPNDYFCPLFADGQRQDLDSRPELKRGAVEFVASPDYMNRPPMAPYYLAVLDVSMGAVQSGFLRSMCETLKEAIGEKKLPGLDRAHFGLITFDTNVHFYNINAKQTTPHISVVSGGPSDIFVPMHEGGMAHIEDNLSSIVDLLEALPTYWQSQTTQEANVSSAFMAARLLLRDNGGKVIFGLSTMPTQPELGLNPNHDVRKDPKGRPLAGQISDDADGLKPSSTYFSSLATTLAHFQISVDLVAAPALAGPMDLATMSEVAHGTGGHLMYYPGYKPEMWGAKLASELTRNLCAPTGWEGVMRVRMSKGWKIDGYSGHYCFRGLDLMMLPCFNDSHTVTIYLDNTESVVSDPICYLQLALLYTTSIGERRIRVLTYALPCTQKLPDISQSVDVATMSHLICSKAMQEALKGKLGDGRSYIQTEMGNVASTLTLTHPVVPPVAEPTFPLDETNAIQQLCLYCVGMLKSVAFRDGKDVTADMRVAYWYRLRAFSSQAILPFFKPILMEVSQPTRDAQPGEVSLPPLVRLSSRCLNPEGVYLCCDGESLYMWIGRSIKPEWLRAVFGVTNYTEVNPYVADAVLSTTGSQAATRLLAIINKLRAMYQVNYMKLLICKQGEAMEYRFMSLLIEDKSHSLGAAFLDVWQKFTMSHQGGMHPQTPYTRIAA